jgi:hypothetical protein
MGIPWDFVRRAFNRIHGRGDGSSVVGRWLFMFREGRKELLCCRLILSVQEYRENEHYFVSLLEKVPYRIG